MLALVVASPAFADWPYGVGVNGDGNGYIGARIIENGAAVNSAACNVVPLTYNGETPDSGTFYLTADWGRDECTIKLDPNNAGGGNVSNNNPWDTLYSRYDEGAYLDSTRTKLMTTSQFGLSSTPIGANVTVTWNLNAPNGHDNSEVTPGSIANSVAPRTFNGFFPTTSGGTKYIENTAVNDEYHITSDGALAAKTVAKDSNGRCPGTTWYAQWGCANMSFPSDPVLPGYEFLGWYDAATNGNKITTICDNDLNLYAHWKNRSYAVTYKCSTDGNGNKGTGWTESTDDSGADSVTYDETIYNFRKPEETCEWADHQITGWKCEEDNNGSSVEPWDDNTSNPWHLTTDVICVAQWAGLHTLTYNCNNDNLGVDPQGGSFATGAPLQLLKVNNAGNCNAPEGKHFAGWTCGAVTNYTTVCSGNSGNCTITAPNNDVTCIAQWEMNEINLVWVYDNATDDNEGTLNQNTTCLYNSEAGTAGGIGGATGIYYNQTTNPDGIPVPVKTGYTFKGWVVTNHED